MGCRFCFETYQVVFNSSMWILLWICALETEQVRSYSLIIIKSMFIVISTTQSYCTVAKKAFDDLWLETERFWCQRGEIADWEPVSITILSTLLCRSNTTFARLHIYLGSSFFQLLWIHFLFPSPNRSRESHGGKISLFVRSPASVGNSLREKAKETKGVHSRRNHCIATNEWVVVLATGLCSCM